MSHYKFLRIISKETDFINDNELYVYNICSHIKQWYLEYNSTFFWEQLDGK